jgi:hypothetical protein
MKYSKFTLILLLFLLGFLSLSAFYGGIALILSPDGNIFKMPVSILYNSPFNDFLIPGIVLLIVFGIIPALVIYAMIKRTVCPVLEKMNIMYDHHFSWTFTVYIGIAQIIWIDLQTFFINAVDLIHLIYSGIGIAIVCIAFLPATRKHFLKTQKTN